MRDGNPELGAGVLVGTALKQLRRPALADLDLPVAVRSDLVLDGLALLLLLAPGHEALDLGVLVAQVGRAENFGEEVLAGVGNDHVDGFGNCI